MFVVCGFIGAYHVLLDDFVMGLQDAVNKILTFTDEDEVGGQTFNKFPENDAEAAQFWSEVWEELVKDLLKPAPSTTVAASKSAWASTMEPLVSVPVGGLAAFDAAALAAFPILVSAFPTSGIIPVPPPSPLLPLITAGLAQFITGTTDPVGPAEATAGAFKDWVELATFTIPPATATLNFEVSP